MLDIYSYTYIHTYVCISRSSVSPNSHLGLIFCLTDADAAKVLPMQTSQTKYQLAAQMLPDMWTRFTPYYDL